MSASTPAVVIQSGKESLGADVCATLRRLYSRRVLLRAAALTASVLACALATLCLVGVADHLWPLSLAVRFVFLFVVLLASLFFVARGVWAWVRGRSLAEMAREIERAAGTCRNALVTFAEAVETAASSEAYMLARLERQARGELARIDEKSVAPREGLVRGASALAFLLLLMLALSLVIPSTFAREARRVLLLSNDEPLAEGFNSSAAPENAKRGNEAIAFEELRVRVLPPGYSGLGVEEFESDATVRALAGSEIEVTLRARGAATGAQVSFNNVMQPMRALGAGRFSATFVATASGAFEARLLAREESFEPAPMVRAVEVYADAPPEVRLTEPTSDQLLRAVPATPVAVRWAARDDLGLSSVTLKYIKSRGLGDAAKFTSGEMRVAGAVAAGERESGGTAALDLKRLDVEPGDTLVFWVEARDRNPSASNTGRSASAAIAIAGPELTKLSLGDLMPTEIGRFLLSQRQIIIQTEKLHAERARLSKEELSRRSNNIAADQREFRNSFNDYIHAEGAGEEEGTNGAAQSVEEQVRAAEDERISPHFHGIPEPPAGAPASVKELTYAIRAMWDAEDALTNVDTALALKHEREALVRLKRAQSAVRYVPPIVARSQPIDLKRRYAGELAEIKTRLEKLARRPESPLSRPLRAALADAYAALDDLRGTLDVSAAARTGAIGRARERARAAADGLLAASSGNHAATIADAAGQLRVVEMELARVETEGGAEAYAGRISKPLALLAQAASNLFAIAESSTDAGSGNDANTLLPAADARAADYFRRLAGGGR